MLPYTAENPINIRYLTRKHGSLFQKALPGVRSLGPTSFLLSYVLTLPIVAFAWYSIDGDRFAVLDIYIPSKTLS